MTDNIGQISKRTAKGAVWLIGSRLATRGIDFTTMLVVAKILTPADFGLVAIASTIILIVEAILELPVSQILVRIDSQDRELYDTAFTLSFCRALVLALSVISMSLPFSLVYHDKRLIPVILVLSLAPIFRGLQSPKMAVFARKLDFRRDFGIDMSGKIFGFIAAVAVATTTHSYWALVVNMVGTPIIMMAVSYLLAPYRPRLSLAKWSAFAGYLGWNTAAQAVVAISWQCDRLILGGVVSKRALGEFSLANDLSYLPEQALIKPIGRPLISAFALVKDDIGRLRSAYAKAADAILTVGAPVMLSLSILATPLVRLALGPKWMAATPILEWLALSLIPPLFYAPLQALAIALGRNRTFLVRSTFELIIKLPLVFAGAYYFGVSGVVGARIATSVAVAIVSMMLVRDLLGTPMLVQLVRTWRIALSAVALALVLLLARPLTESLTGFALAIALSLSGGLALVAYITTLFITWWLSGRPSGIEATASARLVRLVRHDQ